MDEYAGRVLAERYRLPVRPLGNGNFTGNDNFTGSHVGDSGNGSDDGNGNGSGSGFTDGDVTETRAFDTYSGQEVLVRQVPLPEVVEAEVVGVGAVGAGGMGAGSGDAEAAGFADRRPGGGFGAGRPGRRADRNPRDPVVRRALEAATTVAQLPDHPRLEQVFDVFVQDGSLWIVGELLTARPLAALLAERPLSAHRATEIAADLLTALRVLHADGLLHRNITVRTVLICDDGRAILTGLAAGAAQEALCGYDSPPGVDAGAEGGAGADGEAEAGVGAGAADKISLAKPSPAADDTATATATTIAETTTAETAIASGRPTTALAAERARQARLTVVGPVTERWAPEQAGPPYENGQWALPVGPATDLWAVGALLFRSVQGHPPFPEDSAAELARLVRAEPPAAAGECGTLRPVVESLLCQDPAARPDADELHRQLRALLRTAPEPDVGRRLVTMPALEPGGDARRLPILRRRGELVPWGRPGKSRTAARRAAPAQPSRARRTAATTAPAPPGPRTPAPRTSGPRRGPHSLKPPRQLKQPKPPRQPKPPKEPKPLRVSRPAARPTARPARTDGWGGPAGRSRTTDRDLYEQQMLGQVDVGAAVRPARPARGGNPRHLGRILLTVILLLLVCAVVYATAFMPKAGRDAESGGPGADRAATSGAAPGGDPAPSGGQDGDQSGDRDGDQGGDSPGTTAPRPTTSAGLAKGFGLRTDPKGFQIAVPEDWQRRGANNQGQVRYVGKGDKGDHELLIVPGRDTTARFGTDPLAYLQNKEPELAAYRSSGWATASGLRRVDVGTTAMAEGTFSWRDTSGREVYVRNLAMIHHGRYHLVLVIGPDTGRQETDRLYEQATSSYRPR
ncbi:protein kinase [Streptomyces sp. NPDC001339]|uniref:protein kinase n=1 Tax=Streptomyces sp. NPDC001339 TaxID=3364563 RepID=UPI0036B6770B